MEYVDFKNDKMPILGFGTYKIDDDALAKECALDALEIGYRMIDTARFYQNEKGIGDAIKESGLKRDELFITTKLWTDANTKEKVREQVEDSLTKLKLDYVNLLLIHWPIPANVEVFETFLRLKEEGLIKNAGTSNFQTHHIQEIIDKLGVAPVLNQVELHPLFQQSAMRDYCGKKGIQVQAWAPLYRGKVFDDSTIQEIANKYNATPAQVILRYEIQKGIAVIPKSTHKERIAENFDVFKFKLGDEDIAKLEAMDTNIRRFRDPDNHGF